MSTSRKFRSWTDLCLAATMAFVLSPQSAFAKRDLSGTEIETYSHFIQSDTPCGQLDRLKEDGRLTVADFDQAEATLDVEAKESGADSAETRVCMINLALLYKESVAWRGEFAAEWPGYDKAEALFVRAWESASRTFGPSDPRSWAAANYLANFYVVIGTKIPAVHQRAREVIDAVIPQKDTPISADPKLATLELYAREFAPSSEKKEIWGRLAHLFESDRTFPRKRLVDALMAQSSAYGPSDDPREVAEIWKKIIAVQRSNPELRGGLSRSFRTLAHISRLAGMETEAVEAERNADATEARDIERLTRSERQVAPRANLPPLPPSPLPPPPPSPPSYSASRSTSPALMQALQRSGEERAILGGAQQDLADGRYDAAIAKIGTFRTMRIESGERPGFDSELTTSAAILASALMAKGRDDEALETLNATLNHLRAGGVEDLPAAQVIQLLIPAVLFKKGQVGRAEEQFLALARRSSVDEAVRQIALLRLAEIWLLDGRLDDAEAALRRLPDTLPGATSTNSALDLQLARAQAMLLRGNRDLANGILTRAREAIRRDYPAGHPREQDVQLLMAQAELVAQPKSAEANLRAILSQLSASGQDDQPKAAMGRDLLAISLRVQGRFAEALPLYRRTLDELASRYGPDNPTTLASANEWMSALLEAGSASDGDVDTVRVTSRAVRALRRNGEELRPAYGSEKSQDSRRFFATAANLLWEHSATRAAALGEAFLALQDSTEGDADRTFRRRVGRQAAVALGTELLQLVQRRDELLQVGPHGASGSSFDGSVASLVADAQRTGRTRELINVTDQIRSRFPDYFALVSGEAVDIAAVKRVLKPDEALLLIVPTERGTHLVAVTPRGERWLRTEVSEQEIARTARRLLSDASLENLDPDSSAEFERRQTPGRPAFDRTAAFMLYSQLILPLEQNLRGTKRLIVSASGPLASLPFAILVSRPPVGRDDEPDDLRKTAWLADAYSLSQIPSVQSLLLLRQRPITPARAPQASPTAVGIGNPALYIEGSKRGPGTSRGMKLGRIALVPALKPVEAELADSATLSRLYSLPGTAGELTALEKIAGPMNSRIFSGRRATERNVRSSDLSKASLLLFATHGIVPDQVGEDGRTAGEIFRIAEPGLVLTPPDVATADDDGFLAASEVATLKLNAEWAILSACNTATTSESNAQGISALARAFFYAGATSILASYWLVDDKVAPIITENAVRRLWAGATRADALRIAAAEVRNGGSDGSFPREWSHPYYWSPFVLIGDSQ